MIFFLKKLLSSGKMKRYFFEHKVFCLIVIFLIMLPFFWFPKNSYLLGDDDTGLSYYEPLGSLINFSSVWYSADALPRNGPTIGSEAMFAFLLYIIKLITFGMINLQALSFGFILSVSFIYIVKILKLLNEEKEPLAYYVAGLFYCLSPYFTVVEYYYLLPSTFVIVVAPILTFCLLKSIKTESNKYIIIGAIVSLFFSRVLFTPVFINFFAFLFIFCLLQTYFSSDGSKKIGKAILYFLKMTLCILFINAMIFIPLFQSFLSSADNSLSASILDRTQKKYLMVADLTKEFNINKISDFFTNSFPDEISKAQGFRNYAVYEDYYNKVLPSMYTLGAFLFLGLLLLSRKKWIIVLPVISMFILSSLFLFVDIFDFFKRFYVFLMLNTAIFNMNRYPSMKFHIPFIFYYSLLIGLVFSFLFKKIKPKFVIYIFAFFVVVIGVTNYCLLSGNIFTDKLKPTNTARAMDFNDDYKKLVSDFSSYVHDDAKLLLFPLGYGYGAFIPGKDSTQVYRSTVTGFKSFTGYNLLGNLAVFGSTLDRSLLLFAQKYYFKNDLNIFYSIANKLNIKYIIYSKDLSSLRKYAEILPGSTYNNKNYYSILKNDEPVYENNGYAIYKIKNYDSVSQFTTNDPSTEVHFNKISDFMYLLKIRTSHADNLVLHEGFSNLWNVYKINEADFDCLNTTNYAKDYPRIFECQHVHNNIEGNLRLATMLSLPRYNFLHEKYDDYLNSWSIDSDGEFIYLVVIMDGQKYYLLGIALTLAVFLSFSVYLIRGARKK